jgi:hypothetical protein
MGASPIPPLEQAEWTPLLFATVHPEPKECAKCGYFAAGADKFCNACYKYGILVNNANKTRVSGFTPGVDMSLQDFASWYGSQVKKCHYCHLPEDAIPDIRATTQVGHPLKRLGLDRIDNDRGYTVDNIVLCCFPCNKAKGNVFSEEEMRTQIGPYISRVWKDPILSEQNPNYRPSPNFDPSWN